MGLLLFIVFLSSILVAGCFVVAEVNSGKYKMQNNSKEIEEELIKEFESKYPNKTAKDLKIEIEKISDMLLCNEESNRYTYRIQEKASKDIKLNKFRKTIVDSVNLLNFKGNKLKAQVNFLDKNNEYTIIMYMDVVARGRVFLKKYKTMRRIVKEGL